MHKSTTELKPADQVATTEPDGTDFGIPLVGPHRGRRADGTSVTRQVRNVVRTGPGMVAWFTDSTKSHPVHGRTAWEVLE